MTSIAVAVGTLLWINLVLFLSAKGILCCDNVTVLHIQSTGYDSRESITAIKNAVSAADAVDGKDFCLMMSHFEDTECNVSLVINWLQIKLTEAPLAVLDGTCPTVSSALQTILLANTTAHVSYTPYSIAADAAANSISLYPALSAFGQYVAVLLSEFNWKALTILTEPGFTEVEAISQDLRRKGISVDIQYIDESNCRNCSTSPLVMLLLGQTWLTEILCNISIKGQTYPDYIYILPYWYDANWWRNASCGEDILSALKFSLSLILQPTAQLHSHQDQIPQSILSLYAHDATATLLEVLADFNSSSTPADIVLTSLEQVNKKGMTGLITFANGTRPLSSVGVYQYRTTNKNQTVLNRIANISNNLVLTFETGVNIHTVLPSINVPRSIHISVTIVFYILAVLGIVITVICLAFNLIFREKRVVKLTSPQLNYIILSGALLIYIAMFFEAIPRLTTIDSIFITIFSCNGSSLAAIGCVICLSTIQGKMFRIFYIFYRPSPNKKRIRDWHIVIYVLIMTGISSLGVVLQWTVPQFRRVARFSPAREFSSYKNELGVSMNPVAYVCLETSSIGGIVRAIIISGSLYLMQLLSLVLSLITRKVSVKVLNDTTAIKGIIVINTFNLTALLLFLIVLQSYPTILISVTSIGFFLVPTVIFLLIFIPKMISLYNDPEGLNVFSMTHVTTNSRRSLAFTRNESPKMNQLKQIGSIKTFSEDFVQGLNKTVTNGQTTD